MADKPADTVNIIPPAVVEKAPVVELADDYEAQLAAKDAEIARLTESDANWKVAALKAKAKLKGVPDPDETEEEKYRRIVREELANSELARLNSEKDAILKKALKENKEMKLAQLNKPDVPASPGAHSDSQPVTDTLITPEQLAAFKARGWTEKEIERYKKNLRRYGR